MTVREDRVWRGGAERRGLDPGSSAAAAGLGPVYDMAEGAH